MSRVERRRSSWPEAFCSRVTPCFRIPDDILCSVVVEFAKKRLEKKARPSHVSDNTPLSYLAVIRVRLTFRVTPSARQDRVAPSPRYLHRVALANDGWHYLFGGHRQLDVVGDVWRFRVENRQRRSAKGGFARVSVRWEHVDGGASVGDGGSDSDSDGVDDGAAGSRGSATESESESESEEELDEGNPAVDGAILPPVVVGPQPLPMAPEVVAAGVPGMGVPENQELFFEGDPLPADFDANGKPTRPRPRCAASWVCVPGGNKIYLYGGHGSGNDFLDDLWCFHAGARGECRWEKLDAVGALRPRESEDQDEGREANVGRFSVPDGRWGHTMVEHRGALYMFGGSSPGHAYAGLWLLDTSVSPCVWSLLKPEGEQPPARGGHSATVVGDTLYIFGGNIITVRQFRWSRLECRREEAIREPGTWYDTGTNIYLFFYFFTDGANSNP